MWETQCHKTIPKFEVYEFGHTMTGMMFGMNPKMVIFCGCCIIGALGTLGTLGGITG